VNPLRIFIWVKSHLLKNQSVNELANRKIFVYLIRKFQEPQSLLTEFSMTQVSEQHKIPDNN